MDLSVFVRDNMAVLIAFGFLVVCMAVTLLLTSRQDEDM